MTISPDLSPIPEVAERITGTRPSPATTHRWRMRGVRGAKLSAVFLLGKWRTTEAEFLRFLAEMSKTPAPPEEPAIPERDAVTERRLRDAKLI